MLGKWTRTWISRAALMLIAAAALVGVLSAVDVGPAKAGTGCTIQYDGHWTYGEITANGNYDCEAAQNNPDILTGKQKLQDVDGNFLTSDLPKPGVVRNWNWFDEPTQPMVWGTYGGEFFPTPICVDVSTGRETDAPCISGPPTRVQNFVPRNQDCIPHCSVVTTLRVVQRETAAKRERPAPNLTRGEENYYCKINGVPVDCDELRNTRPRGFPSIFD